MSEKMKFVENVERQKFDLEEYRKRAAEKEAGMEEDDEKSKKRKQIVVRSALKGREYTLDLTSRVGKYSVVTNSTPLEGRGGYYCKTCECLLKDSSTYLDHINGKKHQKALGMNMRVERSSLQKVRDRLSKIKEEKEQSTQKMGIAERLAAYELQVAERKKKKKEAKELAKQKRKGGNADAVGDPTIDDEDVEGGAGDEICPNADGAIHDAPLVSETSREGTNEVDVAASTAHHDRDRDNRSRSRDRVTSSRTRSRSPVRREESGRREEDRGRDRERVRSRHGSRSRSRSRSPIRSRRSRSPGRDRSRRSRSRDRSRRSRSRSSSRSRRHERKRSRERR